MNAWTNDELRTIGDVQEIRIAPRREDGSLQPSRIIWVVRHGDDLFVRSVNGVAGGWFRGTRVRHEARIEAGDVARDVALEDADHGLDDAIDEGYRTKYGSTSSSVGRMTGADARATTLRLTPA